MTEATGRVSNKQILTALTDLPAQIAAALAGAMPAAPAVIPTLDPIDDAVPTVAVVGEDIKAKLDPGYVTHVTATLQKRANETGMDYVLYARKNKRDENKLAYCAADKWAGLTDRRIIGPVSTVSPK